LSSYAQLGLSDPGEELFIRLFRVEKTLYKFLESTAE